MAEGDAGHGHGRESHCQDRGRLDDQFRFFIDRDSGKIGSQKAEHRLVKHDIEGRRRLRQKQGDDGF